MNDNGYVYVLMNPSMQNLVKIGKTTREPEKRAKELSSTTGVPTPFVVVYSCYFESCSDAESFIHKYLEKQDFRVSSNREFFEIPIKDAIDAVMKAKEEFGEFQKINLEDDKDFEDDFDEYDPDVDNEEIVALNSKAFDLQYGLDDEIEDIDEAIKYYLKSLKLGSKEAKEQLETIYDDLISDNDNEENYKKAVKYGMEGLKIGLKNLSHALGAIYDNPEYSIYNMDKAISYYKEGFRNNDEMCCLRLAIIYHKNNDEDNAYKCYSKYFQLRNVERELYAYFGASYLNFVATFPKHKIEFIEHLQPNIDSIIHELSNGALRFINREEGLIIHPDFIEYAKEVINGKREQDDKILTKD